VAVGFVGAREGYSVGYSVGASDANNTKKLPTST
jgi:hypothetical protein